MTVPANKSSSPARRFQAPADDVNNALLGRIHVEQRNLRTRGNFLQRFNLLRCDRVGDRQTRGVVGMFGLQLHRTKGWRTGRPFARNPSKAWGDVNFVHQVQVDIEQCRLPFRLGDYVRVPNFSKRVRGGMEANYQHLI